MNNRKSGFTIIELMVVIVVVTLLSTISVATYRSFLQSGRDASRLVNVKNISKIVKVDRASKNEGNYDLLKAQIIGIAAERALKIPEPLGEKHYFYGYSVKKDDFFVVVCGESNELLVQGTVNGILAAKSVDSEIACTTDGVPVKEVAVPVDENAETTSLDAYTIYMLS